MVSGLKFWSLLLVLCSSFFSYSQQAIVTAGGMSTGSGGSVSFSIGQIDFISVASNNITVSQGVQQAHEIFIISSVQELVSPFGFSLYPNPCSNFLTLKTLDVFNEYSYRVHDISGKEVSKSEITDAFTHIPLADINAGIYFITVFKGSSVLDIFKVVKQ